MDLLHSLLPPHRHVVRQNSNNLLSRPVRVQIPRSAGLGRPLAGRAASHILVVVIRSRPAIVIVHRRSPLPLAFILTRVTVCLFLGLSGPDLPPEGGAVEALQVEHLVHLVDAEALAQVVEHALEQLQVDVGASLDVVVVGVKGAGGDGGGGGRGSEVGLVRDVVAKVLFQLAHEGVDLGFG